MSAFRVAIRGTIGALRLSVDLQGDNRPLALVGPNGSGKTTLLRAIAGERVLGAAEGEIELDGRLLFSSARGVDLPAEARRVGYVPQGYGLFPHLRVLDNVAFGLAVGALKQARGPRLRVARAMLEALGCGELWNRFPHQLSGGEKQRVALARALVVEPAILLLDEPLSALDAEKRRRVRALLARRLRALGRPSIVVTHDVRDAVALDAQVCVLERGCVVQQGSVEQLRARPQNEYVAEFVGYAGVALPEVAAVNQTTSLF